MSTNKNKNPSVKVTKYSSVQADAGKNWGEIQRHSSAVLAPVMNCAAVVEAYANAPFGEVDLVGIISNLNEQIEQIQKGDMSGPEAILFAQATALQAMFVNLARRAHAQEHLLQFETYMTLALKAQTQCRTTLEALNEIKFPRSATFVKQANIANQQQVNNGVCPRAEEIGITPNKQLTETKHETLELGGATKTEPANSPVASVGKIDRPTNRPRQRTKRKKRSQARDAFKGASERDAPAK